MDDIREQVIELLDAGRLDEAFDEFTSDCNSYQSCKLGQQNHSNCISTCLTPKLRHMSLISQDEKWSERIKVVEAALGNIGQVEIKHFEWTETYKIGHRKIDADHRQIIDIVNDLVDAYLVEDMALCDLKLKDFKVKLAQHFADEEIIMAKLHFVDPNHDKLHEDIENALDKLTGNYETLAEWRDCIETLLDKFIVLVLKHDFKFAAHLEAIGYTD